MDLTDFCCLRPSHRPAASAGPVVTINVSKDRCDAMVIMPNHHNVLHIVLDKFSYEEADQLYKSLQFLLKQGGAFRDANRYGKKIQQHPKNLETEFESILSSLWFGVAKPVLDGLAITVCFWIIYFDILLNLIYFIDSWFNSS
jgi:hypothetical protein